MIVQPRGNDGKNTVLIVDHDESALSYYGRVLGREYRLLLAATGKCALDVPHEGVDVALVEFRLPDMPGMMVLKAIRAKRPSMPLLVVTQYGCEEAAVAAFRSGARDYLKKPVGYLELHCAIEACLGSRPLAGESDWVASGVGNTGSGSPWHDITSSGGMDLQAAIKFINDNYMESISLSAVAHQAALSKYHFCHKFKRQLGVSFKEYLNLTRIRRAKELLVNGQRSITEVALTVGYGDVTHFGRIFRRLHGCTPSQYMAASKKTVAPFTRAPGRQPSAFSGRGDPAHGPLGQCGDGERRVHARVGRDG